MADDKLPAGNDTTANGKTQKEWTVMVYMAGDNNLSENMAFSLEGLGAFSGTNKPGDSKRINLLAYFDGNSLTAPTHYIDYSEVCAGKPAIPHPVTQKDIYHPREDGSDDDINAESETANYTPKKQNSASAYSILNFVRWCIIEQGRTAKNYALIFSGHSFGFHGTSFMRDESSGSYMTLFKFRWALEKINQLYSNETLGDRIAILGFDSCVMSMLEVGYELKDVAQTVVASEGSLPNSGWGYAPILTEFIRALPPFEEDSGTFAKSTTQVALSNYLKVAAKSFVTAFIEQHKNLAIGGRSVDMSAWDLDKVSPLAESVNALAIELNKHLDLTARFEADTISDVDIALLQELKKVVLQSHFDSQTYMEEQCVDLKDFCLRLILESKFLETGAHSTVFQEVIDLSGKVIEAIDECVLICGYSGDEYQFSNGISMYFPWSHLTYFLTDFRYRYLRFNRGAGNRDLENPIGVGKDWNAFLYNYLTRVALRRARKDSHGRLSTLDHIDRANPPWSKANPPWSRANPPWSRANPPWSKANPPWSKGSPGTGGGPLGKANPPWSRGEVGEYLFYFGRFKNFEMRWDISGYSDERHAEDDPSGENPQD